MKHKAYGFTIVELLIVIVVVAILAALSYVGYMSISNRANDSVVQNDLVQFSKQIQLMYAEKGVYPVGGVLRIDSATSAPGSNSRLIEPGVMFRVATSSYSHPTAGGSANFIYCTGPNVGSVDYGFAILAQSASGNMYKYGSNGNGQLAGSRSVDMGVALTAACADFGYPRSYSYGYSVSSGWSTWTQ